jgi:hypothetical protein
MLFFLATAGLLTGGAMGAVQRFEGSRKGWLVALGMASAAALFLWLSLAQMKKL